MDLFRTIMHRLNVIGAFKELGSTRERRKVLLSLSVGQLLLQLSQLPIAIAIPSVARHFDIPVTQASWMVIVRLLLLGSTVFLAARLGQRYGHLRIFIAGIVLMTLSSALASTSQYFVQLLFWSAGVGLGGALLSANANAILVMAFGDQERGRAFAVPITSARIGTLTGLILFGLFLQFLSWRFVFLTSLPIGLIALWVALPLLKNKSLNERENKQKDKLGFVGPVLMIATLSAFILTGIHLHSGPDSFSTVAAMNYHPKMFLGFLGLAILFFVAQIFSKNPYFDFSYFKKKYFSMALFSNTTFHLSMLSVLTLVPIVIEEGLGMGPAVVVLILLPHQSMGLFLPAIAGWIYDRYNPKWLRPGSLLLIAIGLALLGLFAGKLPIYTLPILLFPASIGSALFNSPNNALVMNTLPENRSFASGMLETTRQMGHTIGSIVGAAIVGLSLPLLIDSLPTNEAQHFYLQGFRYSALIVVWIMISGSIVALFHRDQPA